MGAGRRSQPPLVSPTRLQPLGVHGGGGWTCLCHVCEFTLFYNQQMSHGVLREVCGLPARQSSTPLQTFSRTQPWPSCAWTSCTATLHARRRVGIAVSLHALQATMAQRRLGVSGRAPAVGRLFLLAGYANCELSTWTGLQHGGGSTICTRTRSLGTYGICWSSLCCRAARAAEHLEMYPDEFPSPDPARERYPDAFTLFIFSFFSAPMHRDELGGGSFVFCFPRARLWRDSCRRVFV